MFLPIFSGNAILRAPLAVEVLGGGQDPGPDDGPGRGGVHRDREEDEEEADPRLPVGELEVPQLVGLPVLSVRGACSCQCYRANVPDEPVLRRRVPHLRAGRDRLHGVRPGGSHRPHDLYISKDGEVHTVQQVRVVGRGGAARRALHPAAQRGQREDLRVPVVLVRHPRHPHVRHARVPAGDHLLAAHARVHDADAVPAGAARQRRHHRAPQQDGRLVPPVHPGREPGLGDLPGHHARVREQAEPQLPAPHPRRAGRVTSGAGVGVPHVTDAAAAPAAGLTAPPQGASPQDNTNQCKDYFYRYFLIEIVTVQF